MNRIRIRILMLFVLLPPFMVFAQPVKCLDSDGKIINSDSQCPSDNASGKNNTSSPLRAELGKFSKNNNAVPIMPSDSCMQENQNAAKQCGDISIGIVKQCMRERLSPGCLKQYESGSKSIQTADQGCKQEIQAAAMPCAQIQIIKGKQCVQDRLGPKCKEETNKFNADFERSRKQCEDVMLKMRETCSGTNDVFVQCMQRHQTEIKTACDFLKK